MTHEEYCGKIFNMGLFDRVYCKVKLPLPKDMQGLPDKDWANEEFQSKDLQLWMHDYQIREDGSLYCDEDHVESYHGSFYFYTHFLEEDLPNDYRIEFKAIFAYGKLKEIQLIEFDAYPNNKRKDFQEENKAKEEARKIYVKTLKYKIYYYLYRRPVLFLFNKIFDTIDRISFRRIQCQHFLMFMD